MMITDDMDPHGDVRLILSERTWPFAPFSLPSPSRDSNQRATADGSDTEDEVNATVKEAAPLGEYQLRVSSKHLMLASPWLHKMFSGNWKEATHRDDDGLLSWNLDDFFDHNAFIIVMNVIHGRNSKVPRVVDLELLAKIAVVTDYLQCHESVEVASALWLEKLNDSLPETFCRDLILWIMVSSVFRDQESFRSVTRTAIVNSREEVPSIGLPIHQDVIRKIEDRRQDLLEMLLGSLYDAIDLLRAGTCGHACDAMLLGTLIRQMEAVDLLQPRKNRPFHGISAMTLDLDISLLSTPKWHHPTKKSKTKKKKKKKKKEKYNDSSDGETSSQAEGREAPTCELQALFLHVEDLVDDVTGLDLKEVFG